MNSGWHLKFGLNIKLISNLKTFIIGFPASLDTNRGSGVTDSEPVSVFMAVGMEGVETGNDELPYKFSVHEYLNLRRKILNHLNSVST